MEVELPIGEALDWRPARRPEPRRLRGRYVLLRPLELGDAEPLYHELHPPVAPPGLWHYLFEGPFAGPSDLRRYLAAALAAEERMYFAVAPLPGELPAGIASYLRMQPEHGSIEIGNLAFGGRLQRTTAATEAVFLLAAHAFDELGYRRVEWKCNALNQASRRAAERFGFRFEGVFRRHMVVKGRNRDTAWFAITGDEWPDVRAGFEAWLAPANHDDQGVQRATLSQLIAARRE